MLLRGLPADFRRPAACYLKGFAGVLPGSLRKRLMEKIASELCCTYGCNETGNIALIGEDGIGTLLAGVEAAVIDESGAGKPHGEVGLIKVKTDTMVQVDRSADRNSIQARLPGVVPADLGVVHFLLSETLPRTQNGKLIKRDIEAHLRKSLGR
jgi:hypothetical protein